MQSRIRTAIVGFFVGQRQTKDEFITAMKDLNFKDVYTAWSRSSYAGGKKTVVRIEDGWLYYSAGSIKEEI